MGMRGRRLFLFFGGLRILTSELIWVSLDSVCFSMWYMLLIVKPRIEGNFSLRMLWRERYYVYYIIGGNFLQKYPFKAHANCRKHLEYIIGAYCYTPQNMLSSHAQYYVHGKIIET